MFSGESPTKPWTDVCLAHRTGQRISGPLFFGFSDAVTQRAIAANLYSAAELRAALQVGLRGLVGGMGHQPGPCSGAGPARRAAAGALRCSRVPAALPPLHTPEVRPGHTCLQGERVEADAATPEEAAAREFATVDGIGEATAILLARTRALGGATHASLDSLRGWASASGAATAGHRVIAPVGGGAAGLMLRRPPGLSPQSPGLSLRVASAPPAEANARTLFDYLTASSELPEATRRWPAWRQRVAPKIVLALSGRWLGAGPPLAAGAESDVAAEEAQPAEGAAACGASGEQAAAAEGQTAAAGQQQQQRQAAEPPSKPAGSSVAKENKQPGAGKLATAAAAAGAASLSFP